jgi:hypothetical protein
MQKKILFFTMGTLLLAFAGCNPKGGETKTNHQLLSKNIEYDVTINNYKFMKLWGGEVSADLWFRDNLEGSVRSGYMELLWKNALAGKLELYDMNDKKIDTTELKKILTITDSLQIEIGNKLVDTVIRKTIDPNETTKLRFREEWTYDPTTMVISKKVLAIAPILRTTEVYDNNGNETYCKDKALFWVKFSKEPSNTKVLTKRIMTNTSYRYCKELNNIKNADTAELKKYTDLLCNKAFKDSIDAYDVVSGPPAWLQISGKDLSRLLNKVDTIKSNGKDTVIKRMPNFTTIRFLEEWNFDPNTMAIQKTVVGLCPVIALYEADGVTFKGYMPCFWVYFKDIWTPFDGKLELKKLEKKKEK